MLYFCIGRFTSSRAAGEGGYWSMNNPKNKKWATLINQTFDGIIHLAIEGPGFED